MDIRPSGRQRLILWPAAGFALAGVLTLGRVSAGSPPAPDPPSPAQPNIVLSGSYSCSYNVTSYYTGPDTPPATYAETSDSLGLTTTGGYAPPMGQAPPFAGSGGFGPGRGGPQTPMIATPIAGFSTGHSFTDGSIEDCVRFAQVMSTTATGLGCATSEVRRRQLPIVIGSNSAGASFAFICEGPAADIVHAMGDLGRAVLALKLQTAH